MTINATIKARNVASTSQNVAPTSLEEEEDDDDALLADSAELGIEFGSTEIKILNGEMNVIIRCYVPGIFQKVGKSL